jgi:hypothetical protein
MISCPGESNGAAVFDRDFPATGIGAVQGARTANDTPLTFHRCPSIHLHHYEPWQD